MKYLRLILAGHVISMMFLFHKGIRPEQTTCLWISLGLILLTMVFFKIKFKEKYL